MKVEGYKIILNTGLSYMFDNSYLNREDTLGAIEVYANDENTVYKEDTLLGIFSLTTLLSCVLYERDVTTIKELQDQFAEPDISDDELDAVKHLFSK